jgi:hypothetical protein
VYLLLFARKGSGNENNVERERESMNSVKHRSFSEEYKGGATVCFLSPLIVSEIGVDELFIVAK